MLIAFRWSASNSVRGMLCIWVSDSPKNPMGSSMKSLTEGADCSVRLICSPMLCQGRVAACRAPRHDYTLRGNADNRKSAVACNLRRERGVTALVETDTQQRLGVRRGDEQLIGGSAADTDVGGQRTPGQRDAGGPLTGIVDDVDAVGRGQCHPGLPPRTDRHPIRPA